MEQVSLELTIFFEDGFYHGLFESRRGSNLTVCKVTFGAEPKGAELLDFINRQFSSLEFSPALTDERRQKKSNPKRLQRLARREMQQQALSTKSQKALKLQQEERKRSRHFQSKAEKRADQERKFALKQQKRQDKHRGH